MLVTHIKSLSQLIYFFRFDTKNVIFNDGAILPEDCRRTDTGLVQDCCRTVAGLSQDWYRTVVGIRSYDQSEVFKVRQ